jgi:hypothetical protein
MTHNELLAAAHAHQQELTQLISLAHRTSLADDNPEPLCSIVALSRTDGQVAHQVLQTEEERPDLYILAAYAHVNPLDASGLYSDELADILGNWCLDQGLMAPEQGDAEPDAAYLTRLTGWMADHTGATAPEILNDAIRVQLLENFDAASELADALAELDCLARGVTPPGPPDDPADI